MIDSEKYMQIGEAAQAVAPIVHLNGTGFETLSREIFDALTAVKEAEESIARCTLHLRDYYVAEDSAGRFDAALCRRREALLSLEAVRAYLDGSLAGVLEQRKATGRAGA